MTTLPEGVTTLPKVAARPSSCQDLAHDHCRSDAITAHWAQVASGAGES
jgi:hypothetical protein